VRCPTRSLIDALPHRCSLSPPVSHLCDHRCISTYSVFPHRTYPFARQCQNTPSSDVCLHLQPSQPHISLPCTQRRPPPSLMHVGVATTIPSRLCQHNDNQIPVFCTGITLHERIQEPDRLVVERCLLFVPCVCEARPFLTSAVGLSTRARMRTTTSHPSHIRSHTRQAPSRPLFPFLFYPSLCSII
jgi:hypothetical protein